MKRRLVIFICVFVTVISVLSGCGTQKNPLLWEKATNDYASYRIPGIVATKEGTLLTYCEARRSTEDWADIDIQMRRSTDQGKTWSDPVILGDSIPSGTRNNPVMLVDSNNKIHMIISYKYGISMAGGKVYYLSSEDDGVTWSEPEDITDQTQGGSVRHAQFACGPSHGIELKDGTLVFPFWFVEEKDFTEKTNNSPSHISTLYSKDSGKTWQIGEVLDIEEGITDPSEPCIVQLSTGEVMLNVRVGGIETSLRGVAVSPDGISGWSKIRYEEQLRDPGCEGSIVRYDDSTILFTNCNMERSVADKDRLNLTVRYSKDDGKTWSAGTVVCESDSMYSDMAVIGEKIFVVYEEGFYDGLSIRLKEYKLSDIQ